LQKCLISQTSLGPVSGQFLERNDRVSPTVTRFDRAVNNAALQLTPPTSSAIAPLRRYRESFQLGWVPSESRSRTASRHTQTEPHSEPKPPPPQPSAPQRPPPSAADMNEQQLDCALDLMRRLPPQQIEKNLSDLIDLVPSLCEDLLSSVDQPLKIARDKVVGKDYLLCDYNRDGDSYRSPWSNKYEPPIDDGAMPSARLRKLEVEANNAFDQYRDLYFEGGVSSVYLWDLDHGFAGVILIKKAGDGSKKIKGCWDSIHVVEVQEKSSGRTAHYKLTSTVMLWLQTTKTGSGTMNLGGSLTRQMEKDETVSESSPHIANIGRLVEDMENKIRSTLNEIYFGKTKDIVNGLRSVQTLADKSKQEALKNDLMHALSQRKQQS
ncbi:hypothetical protein QQF64_019680, partial [Cirrhinus molitorella]